MPQASEPDIAVVSFASKIAITDSDVICEITGMYAASGDETDDPSEAVSAVALSPSGTWFAINLRAFEKVEMQ